jgi:GT2 family glycosyltransferase
VRRRPAAVTDGRITVVIPAYGHQRLTHRLISDVEDGVEVIVVDNLGGYRPKGGECVVTPGRNLGWVGGCNEGMDVASESGRSEVFVLLNNDTRLSPEFCSQLAAARDDAARPGSPVVGLVGPLYDCGDVEHQLSTHRGPAKAYRSRMVTAPCGWLDGTCLAVTAEAYGRVGGLDPSTFGRYAWGAEVDLAIRVKQSGMGVYVTHRAYLSHRRAATASRLDSHYVRTAVRDMHTGLRRKWGAEYESLRDRAEPW